MNTTITDNLVKAVKELISNKDQITEGYAIMIPYHLFSNLQQSITAYKQEQILNQSEKIGKKVLERGKFNPDQSKPEHSCPNCNGDKFVTKSIVNPDIKEACQECNKPEQTEGKTKEDMLDIVLCPDCFGDGVETCHNPDHGFLSGVMSVMGANESACPCCGHSSDHKMKGKCDTCKCVGQVTKEEYDKYLDEFVDENYQDEVNEHCLKNYLPYQVSKATIPLLKQIEEKDRRIEELENVLTELIQVKDWKDKYGKDEHYLKAQPIAWENARKAIQVNQTNK